MINNADCQKKNPHIKINVFALKFSLRNISQQQFLFPVSAFAFSMFFPKKEDKHRILKTFYNYLTRCVVPKSV